MAAVPLPAGRSFVGKVRDTLAARRAARGGGPSVVVVFLARAREHVVTFAALASVDFGAFHWGWGVGAIVTGVSALLADFAVRG